MNKQGDEKLIGHKPFNEQAAYLTENALDLIKQIMVKHSASVLETMHEHVVSRNEQILSLTRDISDEKAAREAEIHQLQNTVEALKHERNVLQKICAQRSDEAQAIGQKVSVMVEWLAANQPDVFRRGIWDALNTSKEPVYTTVTQIIDGRCKDKDCPYFGQNKASACRCIDD